MSTNVGVVEDSAFPTEAPKKRTRATKKAAEKTPVENVSIEEATSEVVNDDGQKVIAGPPKNKTSRKSNNFNNDEGVIGSRAADSALAKKVPATKTSIKKSEKDKVALWSDKNIRWSDVGTLSKGYNIVTEEAAEKWLSKNGIRKATPEEVATYYGKE